MAIKKYKFSKDCKIELRPFEVDHKTIADQKVLLQYHVTAILSSHEKVNIGYTSTQPGGDFAPLVEPQFPVELYPVVQKQIAEIKASYDTAKRVPAASETTRATG